MPAIFLLLMFTSFCCLIIGLLKPSIFQKLSKKKITRTKIFWYFFTSTVVFFILIGISAPSWTSTWQATEQKKIESDTSSEKVPEKTNNELKNYLQDKFNLSSRSTVSEVIINKNNISIQILPVDYIIGPIIDIALVLNRHPEFSFDKVVIRDGIYEFSFSKKSFELFKKGEINDVQFSKNIELVSTNFETLATNHNTTVENFHLVIENALSDEFALQKFVDNFRKFSCKKDCNIQIYDNSSIKSLTIKYPLTDNEYLQLADHFVAWSIFDAHEVWIYPFQDIKYKELGGKNWKRKPIK